MEPIAMEAFQVSNGLIQISKCRMTFEPWKGTPIANTFGGKPLIDVKGKPVFAELAIMHQFIDEGWEARWTEC